MTSLVDVRVDDILSQYGPSRKIAGGGQKLVFQVNDEEYGQVVLKIGGYTSRRALDRARREAKVLLSIQSSYFPLQYDFQVIDSTRYLIIEEYVHGRPLTNCFNKFKSEERILKLLHQIVCGLSMLWKVKVIHRDIKPANIIINEAGPKIIDLGIARLLDETSLTYTCAPFGPCTPLYASPEQLRNVKVDIDHRSDQFSLGIICAQLVLEGEHPFDTQLNGGENIPANILKGSWAKDKIASCVKPKFYTLLAKLLAPAPYMRYRLANDLLCNIGSISAEVGDD